MTLEEEDVLDTKAYIAKLQNALDRKIRTKEEAVALTYLLTVRDYTLKEAIKLMDKTKF